ncbi:hypothetical protein NC652_029871 [Populus alba x Populus x berolinensis]|nr:hypothetical protein NC652_029871 [Populus alba x Populus x berolinensis]
MIARAGNATDVMVHDVDRTIEKGKSGVLGSQFMIILSMHIVKLISDVMTSFIHIKAKTMPIKGLTSKYHQASGHYLLVEKQIQSTKRDYQELHTVHRFCPKKPPLEKNYVLLRNSLSTAVST